MRTQLQRMFMRQRSPKSGQLSRLRVRLAAALLLGTVAFGSSITDAVAQTPLITYTSAGDVTKGYSSGALVVRVVFNGACTGTKVRVGLPAGISYVPGTVSKVSGTAALGIVYDAGSSTPQSPVFDITGTITTGNDIEFSIGRAADCSASAGGGFDSVYVTFTGGCTGLSMTNNADPAVKNYSILDPSLNFSTAPTAITGAVIGTTATRTMVITNGGNGGTDTMGFYIAYPGGTVSNTAPGNAITANGASFTPYATNGDTLFYKIYGTTAFGMDGILSNAETVTITEPIRVNSCGTSTNSTAYATYWGVNTSPSGRCKYETVSGSVTMASGAATIIIAEQNLIQPSNMCDSAIVEVVIRNNGNELASGAGTAHNITQYIGLHNGDNNGVGGGVRASESVTSFSIKDGANWVPLTSTGGVPAINTGAASASVALSQLTAAPATSYGLIDADGDGVFDDLPVGASFTLRYKIGYMCTPGCSTQVKSGSPYYQATYSNMCGQAATSTQLSGASAATGNGRSIPTENRIRSSAVYPVTAPPDIIDGQVATIRIQGQRDFRVNPAIFTNSSSLYSCPTNLLKLRITVPKGITLSAGRYFQNHSTSINTIVSSNTESYATYDIIEITGRQESYTYFAFEADVVLDCDNYIPGTAISYTVSYVCDASASCGCEEVWACNTIPMTPHCGNCTTGGLTVTSTDIQRTTGGFVSSTSNAWVDVNTLTAKQLRIMTAGDSAVGTFTGKLINGSASPFDAHYFRMYYNAPGGNKAMEILDAQLEVYTGATLSATYNIATASSSAVSSGRHTIMYDLTPYIGSGDSVVLKPRFVMLDNNAVNATAMPLGNMKVDMYSLKTGDPTEYTCDQFSLEQYLHRNYIQLSGGTGAIINASGCATYTNDVYIRTNALGSDMYPGELRALALVDSIKIEITSGDFFNGNLSVTPWGLTSSEGPFTVFSVAPAYTSVDGKTRVYVNDGTWIKPEWQGDGQAYNLYQSLINGCGSLPVGNVITTVYIRRNTTAHSGDFHVAESAVWSREVRNNSMPVLNVQNNTGEIQGVSASQHWDITLSNTTNVNAPNVWFALERSTGSGIVIDSVKKRNGITVGATVPVESTYGTGNQWYKADPTNITNASASQEYRVYFHYTSCNPDSIQLKAGWNCSSYAANPAAYSCTAASTYLKVIPNPSHVQLSIARQPGGGSAIDLCTGDSAVLIVNSAQNAGIVNPYITFTPPAGVTLPATLDVEYPLNSGIYEALPVTFSGGTYTINLKDHSGIDDISGMPGTAANPGVEGRQAKIKVDFMTGCGFTSGTSFSFHAYASRPCGAPATGNGTTVTTDGVNIIGATAPGGAGMSMSFGPATTIGCGSPVTLSATVTPTGIASSTTDTIIYTLPVGVVFDGNLTPGFTAVVSGNTVKIGMPAVVANSPVNIAFDVVASGGGCGSGSVSALYSRQIAPLYCAATTSFCSSSVVIANGSSPSIVIEKPVLSLNSVTYTGGFFRPGQSYTADVSVSNSSSTAAPAATYIVEAFCGSNSMPFDEQVFSPAVAPSGTATGSMTFSVPAVVCHTGDQVTYRIRPLTATSTRQCLCSEASYLSSEALPVKLISFNAYKKGHTALLEWATATEHDSKGFEVQHSTDGSIWSDIGFVSSKAEGGNSRRDYTFTHGKPADGTNLYRLKQSDLNGRHEYSPVRMVSFGKDEGITIYPNPATDMVRIEGLDGDSRIRVYDITGRLMSEQKADSSVAEISLIHLGEGVYHIHILGADGTLTVRKIVKER